MLNPDDYVALNQIKSNKNKDTDLAKILELTNKMLENNPQPTIEEIARNFGMAGRTFSQYLKVHSVIKTSKKKEGRYIVKLKKGLLAKVKEKLESLETEKSTIPLNDIELLIAELKTLSLELKILINKKNYTSVNDNDSTSIKDYREIYETDTKTEKTFRVNFYVLNDFLRALGHLHMNQKDGISQAMYEFLVNHTEEMKE